MLWVLASLRNLLYMLVVSTKCMTYWFWIFIGLSGFNLYDFWVLVVYVMSFGQKQVKISYRLVVLTSFVVYLKGFKLLEV